MALLEGGMHVIFLLAAVVFLKKDLLLQENSNFISAGDLKYTILDHHKIFLDVTVWPKLGISKFQIAI